MHSSPGSPGSASWPGSVRLSNLSSMFGIGMPHEPALRMPCAGVKVPVGDVSVMPQPSHSCAPVSSWKRCATSTGNGAPPEPQNCNERSSPAFTRGWLTIAMHMVGTPQNSEIFFVIRSSTTASRSKRACSTDSAPSRMPYSRFTVSASM